VILVFTCFNIVDDLESFCADKRLFRAFANRLPDATNAVAALADNLCVLTDPPAHL
jgi:hypothetical protein